MDKYSQEWLFLSITLYLPFLLICFINEPLGYLVTAIVFIFLMLCNTFPIIDWISKYYPVFKDIIIITINKIIKPIFYFYLLLLVLFLIGIAVSQ